MPYTAASKAPGIPRNESWVAASEPSSEIETRLMPACLIFSATSFVTRVPLVAKATRRPRLVPYSAKFENVATVKRLAAAQDKDRISELGDLVDDVQGFGSG